MTNGEKFCIDFPNIRIEVFVSYVQVVGENYEFNNLYPLKWWNAEYKEPTTKENLAVDAVSRAEVLKLMQDNWHTHSGDWAMQESIDAIREMPSVTPQEPKTGHWIANAPQYDMLNPQYICSECGNAHTRTTPYCEICGAKMVEPQESEVERCI